MNNGNINILIVDDESLIRDMVDTHLNAAGYNTVEASNGIEALKILDEDPNKFELVILDRNMPLMNGIELLEKLKAHPILKNVPVIMQTGLSKKHEILEGLEAGCYYYLTKPFEKDILISIVKTAISDHQSYRLLQDELNKQSQSLMLLDAGHFSFHTLSEARVLTMLLAAACPEPEKVASGLSELLINAIEHGNLAITYNEKSQLLKDQQWEEEVEHRLTLDKYKDRVVSVEFERCNNQIIITIQDQGNGFEWQQYLEFSPERSLDVHGRGIAMAKMMSFDNLEYKGKGNQVLITINTNQAEEISLSATAG